MITVIITFNYKVFLTVFQNDERRFFDMTVIKVLEEMKLPFHFKIVKHIVKQKRCLKFIMFIQLWIKYFL